MYNQCVKMRNLFSNLYVNKNNVIFETCNLFVKSCNFILNYINVYVKLRNIKINFFGQNLRMCNQCVKINNVHVILVTFMPIKVILFSKHMTSLLNHVILSSIIITPMSNYVILR